MATPTIQDDRLESSVFVERTAQICVGLLALCLAYAAAVSMANGFRLARQPYQFDYEEGNVLNAAVRINHGLSPYPPAGSWPVVLNPYGPVPYYISAGVIGSGEPEFFHARIASLVAAMMVAIEIALLAWTFTGSRLLGVSFGLFFVTLPLLQEWAPLLRVDLMGLAFSLAGLVVFVRWPRLHWLAPLLFALALLCKITFLAAPVACVAILIKRRNWRGLGLGALATVGFLGTVVAALQWSTHGGFLFHQFGTHADPSSWANYRNHFSHVPRGAGVLTVLTLVAIVRTRRLTEPLIYFFLAILGTLTALKLGSTSNHFLEFEAALCVLSAIGILELQKMRRWPLATAGLFVLCSLVLATEGIMNRAYWGSLGLVGGCPQAYAYIHDHDQVLSENVGALVLTGRPVLLSNPYVYAQLVRSGKWQPGRIEQMLRESTASLVMTGKPSVSEQRWSLPALAAQASNYHVAKQFACADAMLAYEPNSPPTTRRR